MFERFTDRARKIMALANTETRKFYHTNIGTEHILLGLIKEGGGVACQVLKRAHIDLDEIRSQTEKRMKKGPEIIIMGRIPQTEQARQAIEHSILIARNKNQDYVGTEHILLGLLTPDEKSLAYRVLTEIGVTSSLVEDNLQQLLSCEDAKHSEPEISRQLLLGVQQAAMQLAKENENDPVFSRLCERLGEDAAMLECFLWRKEHEQA